MLKAPITKTGDIRYFEFIKIFVLVAFFVAFLSVLVERPEYLITVNPIIVSTVVNGIILVTLLLTIVQDLKEIFSVLKDKVLSYIPNYFLHVKEVVVETVIVFVTIFKQDLLQSKLCVIRC